MTWISNHTLVSALSRAGGFGVLACGALPPQALRLEIELTQKLALGLPFGVNLIIFHPNIEELVRVCGEMGVTHVFLGGGIPSQPLVQLLRDWDIRVIGFAPSVLVARRMIRMGVQALVIEGHEAGGHVGPVSTQVLAQEILPQIEVPVFVAGGIGDGRSIVSYLAMGASGCQLGTRFVCATESCAHAAFKEAFIRASARDATLSPQLDPTFPIIPVRALENDGKKKFMEYQAEMIQAYKDQKLSKEEAQMNIEMFWAGALRRAVMEGDVQYGSVMAGQSVGMVRQIESCQSIIDTLVCQAVEHWEGLKKHFVEVGDAVEVRDTQVLEVPSMRSL
jgi:enoyl-[acyl-carrier protein] reductase II